MINFIDLAEVDLVVNCLPGEIGLTATKQAILNGVNIATANKETFVAEGKEIMELAKKHNVSILPIDSEMCAIHQCLRGFSEEEVQNNVEKIVLTCSGGPFLGKTREELEEITLEEALNHPTWPNMGSKITIDSATLMNKGFEVIEASVLFGIDPDKIEVLIHPQSIVHSIVYFKDGNVMMHAASTDMKIPISYCMYYPEVKKSAFKRVDFKEVGKLEFFEPDTGTFTNLNAAYNALRTGTTQKLLRDNDERVEKFLKGKIKFIELFA